MATATKTRWQISGEYFESCNCDVVCPCEVSPLGFLQARPDKGFCDVFLVFHINEGRFSDVDLRGLNFVIAAHAPGVMGQGNWTVAAYIDNKASAKQQEALGAIFTGAAGGPMSVLAPPSRPRPSEGGVVGALARVVPAELVVRIAAAHAGGLDPILEKGMGVLLHHYRIGSRPGHRFDSGV